jgi:hypothetical protein
MNKSFKEKEEILLKEGLIYSCILPDGMPKHIDEEECFSPSRNYLC